jgi:preprotein translocase subunit SecG
LLQTILLILLIFVAAAMVGIILMQQSEGGALGMGGGPSGFMSTRGVGDLLTRTTAILAGVFFTLCIVLTVVSGRAHHGQSVVDRLKIDALSPDALQPKKPLLPPPGSAPTAPALLQAPAPEVHTAPAAPEPRRTVVTRQIAPATIVPSRPISVGASPLLSAPAPAVPAPAASSPAPNTTAPKS